MSEVKLNNLIYDRTATDVERKEKKGQYNASDLNRVEGWCRYLADELNGLNYPVSITTKTNWTSADLRSSADMDRIRSNIVTLKNAYYSYTNIYGNTNNWNWQKANNWERILNEIYENMLSMTNYFVYSGVANSGQNRLYQNRFRHFFEDRQRFKTWYDLASMNIVVWTDFGTIETWEEIENANNN